MTSPSHDNLINIIRLLYSWRTKIIGFVLGIGLLTAVVSLFLTDFYKADTVFYAASADLSNPDEIFSPHGQSSNYYGSGADRDRLMTIAGSNTLMDQMIDTFDLFARYKIDPQHPKARERARLKFSGRYSVIETKHDAIQISVEDPDPIMAARMANSARDFIERIAQEYIHSGHRRLLETIQYSIDQKQMILNTIGDSLSRLQQATGVYDPKEQSRAVGIWLSQKTIELAGFKSRLDTYRQIGYSNRDTIANLTARISGLETEIAGLTGKVNVNGFDANRFNEAAGTVARLQAQHDNTRYQMSNEIDKAIILRAVLESNSPAIIPFESALPPITKYRPVRSRLVIASMLIAFVFAGFFILLWDQLKHAINQQPHP